MQNQDDKACVPWTGNTGFEQDGNVRVPLRLHAVEVWRQLSTAVLYGTDSFVYHIKTEDFYKDIAGDVKKRFNTTGYEDKRPLPIGLNAKKISFMKNELGGKIMTEIVALRAKLYACKKLENEEKKICKGIKKCVVKKTLTFDDYKKCLDNGKNIYKSQLLFQNEDHEVYTTEVNKIALNRDDSSGIQVEDTEDNTEDKGPRAKFLFMAASELLAAMQCCTVE